MSNSENKKLIKLIRINEDASEFYESAQEEVESPRLKETFKDLEVLHSDVTKTLKSRVTMNGGDADVDETVVGQVSEMFGILMSKVSNDTDGMLVTHLEEAEDRCLESMEEVMKSDGITPETKTVLVNELSALRKSHDYMKALKDHMKAA